MLRKWVLSKLGLQKSVTRHLESVIQILDLNLSLKEKPPFYSFKRGKILFSVSHRDPPILCFKFLCFPITKESVSIAAVGTQI